VSYASIRGYYKQLPTKIDLQIAILAKSSFIHLNSSHTWKWNVEHITHVWAMAFANFWVHVYQFPRSDYQTLANKSRASNLFVGRNFNYFFYLCFRIKFDHFISVEHGNLKIPVFRYRDSVRRASLVDFGVEFDEFLLIGDRSSFGVIRIPSSVKTEIGAVTGPKIK
jgi:hypothetical protein